MTYAGQKAAFDAVAAPLYPVTYRSLKVAPTGTWAAGTKTSDYNAGTAAAVVLVKDTLNMAMPAAKVCKAAVYGKLYTSADAVVPENPVKPVKTMPKYVYPGVTVKAAAPAAKTTTTTPAATTTTTTTTTTPAKTTTPAAKTEVKAAKTEVKADAKKEEAKTPKPADGPGKCVKEALCETKDATTKLTISCDAVRLGAAALAALAVASTL